MIRLLKYLAIGLGALFAIVVALVATNRFFPPTYEASAQLPGSPSVVAVQLQPTHLYLAEYRRALVLRNPGAPDLRQDMFPDTGGYSRTQLYQLSDGRFLVEGTFDSFIVDVAAHRISIAPKEASSNAKYLGVFDDTGDGRWRYLAEAESPRKRMGFN
jgi:hypothetical protein